MAKMEYKQIKRDKKLTSEMEEILEDRVQEYVKLLGVDATAFRKVVTLPRDLLAKIPSRRYHHPFRSSSEYNF